MSNMENGTEGFNKFTKFPNAKYKIWGTRGGTTKSLSLTIGTRMSTEPIDVSHKFHNLSHQLKQFFHKHSKDGYYKEKFIFVPHKPDTFVPTGQGYCYFDLQLFLEEEYWKDFINDYIGSLCPIIDSEILGKNQHFNFHKVKQNKLLA